MATPSNKDIYLYEGRATPKNIRLYSLLPITPTSVTIYLYEGEAISKDIRLRNPNVRDEAEEPPVEPDNENVNRLILMGVE